MTRDDEPKPYHEHINDPHNCMVVPRLQVGWVGLLKNASASILSALRSALGPNETPAYVTVDELRRAEVWTFAVVRNPYDRLASCWRHRCFGGWKPVWEEIGVEHEMPFADFVALACDRPDADCVGNQAQHWRSQTWDLLRDGHIAVDFIGRMERLPDAWAAVCRQAAVPLPRQLPVRHRSWRRRQVPWTPDLRAKVAARYAADFDVLGYPT